MVRAIEIVCVDWRTKLIVIVAAINRNLTAKWIVLGILSVMSLTVTANADKQTSQVYSQDNLHVTLTTDSTAHQNTLKLKITDLTTGKAIPERLIPKAWLSLRRSEQVATETSCEAKIRSFASGQLSSRADIDLNSYALLTLNQDKTVAFINPQVSWSSSKLEGIVQLPAQGLDWLLTGDNQSLYVTLPDASAIALIDTKTHHLVSTISTGTGTRPSRIALAPDQQSIWVGLDGSASIAVLDRKPKPTVRHLDVGEGLHQIGFTANSHLVAVTNTQANTLSLVAMPELKKIADIAVPNTPLKAVWVEKAQRFYLISVNDARVSVIDPEKRRIETQIELSRGAIDIAVDPQGRYVWVVNQIDAKAYVIDSATNKTVAFVNLTAEPDQMAFSADYAYFRGLGSEKFVLVNRRQLDQLPPKTGGNPKQTVQELSATQIQAGEKPPATEPDAVGVANMIVPIPEQNGAMIANAPGKTIYYYVEGMMVPMGTLDNYRRMPRGVLVLNRNLRETDPGVFEAPVTIEQTGNYDVAVMLEQPRIVHCFTARLTSDAPQEPQPKIAKMQVNLLPLPKPLVAGIDTLLQFTLHTADKKPVSDVQDARLLAFEPPGLWQKRVWLQDMGNGLYQAMINFPHEGRFNMLLEAQSQGLEFTGQALTTVTVEKAQQE